MNRDSHGGPPTLADDALLAPFREADDPVLTAEEVCDSVPFGPGPTEDGLRRLASEGVLERKAVGGEAVWWLPGHTETDERRGPMPGTTREYENGLPQQLENAIATLDAPDEPERAAVYAVCYYLAENGPATPETLREEVYPEHAAGYEDAEQWWNSCIRPELAALPGLKRENGEDDGAWRLD